MQYLGFNHTKPLASTAGPTTAFDEGDISLFKRVTQEVAHKARPQSTIMSQVDNQVLNEIQYFDGATRFLDEEVDVLRIVFRSPNNKQSEELYSSFRASILSLTSPHQAGNHDNPLKILYNFWSRFLTRNFNRGMYEEFRKYAIKDVRIRQEMYGINKLLCFYDDSLNMENKAMPKGLAKHYVKFVKAEDRQKGRPGSEKLQAAWRNRALDMRSRNNLELFLGARLHEELESVAYQQMGATRVVLIYSVITEASCDLLRSLAGFDFPLLTPCL
jgi:hypothetical protein